MLEINYSLKYEPLIQSFSEKLFDSSIWNDPFNPPLVIFSDPKIERYFKLNCITAKKDDVLMNFRTGKLERMLFSALADGFEHPDVQYERLSLEILRTKLLNRLISKMPDGTYYYQSLGAQEISDYIEMTDGGKQYINQNNLYTLAKNLSRLFNEYMDSRNDEGFHEKWMKEADGSFFDFSALDDEVKSGYTKMELWQKKIYRDLFSESEGNAASKRYVTLAQLAEINKRENGGSLKLRAGNGHIFLFGFNSLGQFYRSLLGKIAEDENTHLHVYLQTNGIPSEACCNPLLKQWNKTGFDNFTLWEKLTSAKKTACGEKQPVSAGDETTLLNELQAQLAEDRYDNEKLIHLAKKDSSITICGAPSPLKEIEALHSSICSIIDRSRKSGKPVSYSDFIVLSPDLEAYRVPVMQVFDELEKNAKNGYPYIPYVFTDHSGENSAVTEALGVFMNILTLNSLYRPDLFALLRNPVVRKARGFSEEEISAWSAWVDRMNGFRNSGNRKHEWQLLTKRLLISTLTETLFDDGSEICKPYSDMNSQDCNSMYKFVAAVDSLEKWRMNFASKTELTLEDVEEINEFFAEWLEMPAETDELLSKENILYSAMREEIENQKLLFEAGYGTVDAASFFHTLKDTASETKSSGSNMYFGGITFSKLTQNRTIPAKYVYILGLNTDIFPKTEKVSSLDLRRGAPARLGDDTPSDKDKEAFLCQVMAAGKSLFLSYINSDLKKDAELFRSSILDDLVYSIAGTDSGTKKEDRELLIKNVENELVTCISIDEDREWSSLFTQRSIRNKENFRHVMDNYDNDASPGSAGQKTIPLKVRVTEMKSFLTNPFVFYAGQFLNTNSSVDEETEKEAKLYEPVCFDILTKINTTADILSKTAECPASVDDVIDAVFYEMELDHQVPDVVFGEVSKKVLKASVKKAIDLLQTLPDYAFSDFVFNRSVHLTLPVQHDEGSSEWTLSGGLCPHCFNMTEDTLCVLDIVYSNEVKTKHKLKAYLTALAVIAELPDDSPVNVEIMIVHDGKLESCTLSQQFSRTEAQDILSRIYHKMYGVEDAKPFNKMILIDVKGDVNEPVKRIYNSYADFLSDAEKDSGWAHFPQKELFDPFKDYGYQVSSFSEEYMAAVDMWKSLVPGLFPGV